MPRNDGVSSYEVLIIANGSFLDSEVIKKTSINHTIIALDGACDKLRKLSIMPDVIIGYFDSIKNEKATIDVVGEVLIIYPKNGS